jgi:hypothetical protein
MAIWDLVAGPIVGIINKLIPDKAAAAAATAQLQQLALQGQLSDELAQLTSITSAQSDVDKVEAASANLFVAGWRPAIGWVCAAAFSFEFILRPIIEWAFIVSGHTLPVKLPRLDDALTQLTYGMLGMGALRTYEKVKGK